MEILKGPASVLYGQGAIGGAVNIVNKAPSFGPTRYDAQLAFGSFNTVALGAGVTGKVSDAAAVRLDVSRTSSDGYIHNSPSDSFDATLSVLWKPTPKLDVQMSIDYLQDHPTNYYGTPLVPTSFATDPLNGVISTHGYSAELTLDKRLQSVNYNVGDYTIESHQVWPQFYVKWRPTDTIDIDNFFYYFKADRRWRNAETYLFDSATKQINRDRFFVNHNQELIGDQGSATFRGDVFGFKNKLVVGFDYSHLNFKRSRGFPDNDEVDPFNPTPGTFGSTANPREAPTYWDDPAAFFEDIFYITSNLKLVTGSRYDYLSLDRQNYGPTGAFQAASSFKHTYQPTTYRVGLVYDVNRYVTPYISYTTGQDPVGSNIFLVNASQNFSLGKSNQIEVGVKASAPQNRAEITVAAYDITRHNVLTAATVDTAIPVGSETSKGVEVSGDVRITDQWSINANASYDDARYGQFSFSDAVTGAYVNANGNELPNAPKWVANVWTSVTQVAHLPLELGGGLRYVGDRQGDYGNTETLRAYTTINIYATYGITPNVDLTFRIDNLADQTYAQAVDVNYERQVILGRPRYYQIEARAHF